ncbi:MAG: TolC family protein [Rhizobiaceae bacterium]
MFEHKGRAFLMDLVKIKNLISIAAALSVLAGCAVRPVAYSTHELATRAGENIARLTLHQEPVGRAIGLHEAMARALKYNLDLRVKEAQVQLANAELDLSHYSLLPNIVSNSGYAARDNLYASKSLDLATGTLDPTSSSSQDKTRYSQDLTFSWNILDFGLSYVRANQAADRYLVTQELQRSVSHKLLEEVRATYWRAIAYDRLVKRLHSLEKRTTRAIQNSRKMSADNQVSRVVALTAERELLKIKRAIKALQGDHYGAKSDLGKLMNLKPGTAFELKEESRNELPSKLPLSTKEMMFAAARDRPEIREIMYRQRINMGEVQAAMLEILPGMNVYAGTNWDSNSFLLNSSWFSWGATISWSLLKLFQYPTRKYTVEAQAELLRRRALTITMSVMTQVHLSRLRYFGSSQEFDVARDYRSVQSRLTKLMRKEAKAARISEQKLLLEEMNLLVAEVKYDVAYAQYQASYANLFASTGADPLGHIDSSDPVAEISKALKRGWSFSNLSKAGTDNNANIQTADRT